MSDPRTSETTTLSTPGSRNVPPAESSTSNLFSWQVKIFSVSWLAYAAFYFPRQAFSAAKVGILDEGFLTRQSMGLLDSAYLAAYAAGQFIWGAAAERFGTRRVVAGGLVMAAVAALAMGIAPAVWFFLPLMIVQGLAQSTGWSALSKNIAAFFKPQARGRAMGLFATSYAFGGLVAAPFAGWVAYSVFDSWRWAFYCTAMVVLAMLIPFLMFQRNSPQEAGLPEMDALGSSGGPRENRTRAAKFSVRDLLAAARHDGMVLKLGLVYFLMKPARYALLLWGPVLVMDAMPHLDALTATLLPVAFGVAGLLAPIVIGWVSDSLFKARRVPPTVLSLLMLVASLAMWPMATTQDSIGMVIALLSCVGFFAYAADSMIAGVAAVDFGTSKHAAGATGFVNGCGSVGAILGGLLPGLLTGSLIFYLFAGASLLAALILLPSWNTRPASA